MVTIVLPHSHVPHDYLLSWSPCTRKKLYIGSGSTDWPCGVYAYGGAWIGKRILLLTCTQEVDGWSRYCAYPILCYCWIRYSFRYPHETSWIDNTSSGIQDIGSSTKSENYRLQKSLWFGYRISGSALCCLPPTLTYCPKTMHSPRDCVWQRDYDSWISITIAIFLTAASQWSDITQIMLPAFNSIALIKIFCWIWIQLYRLVRVLYIVILSRVTSSIAFLLTKSTTQFRQVIWTFGDNHLIHPTNLYMNNTGYIELICGTATVIEKATSCIYIGRYF